MSKTLNVFIPVLPPGFNATYKVNRTNKRPIYLSKAARQWDVDAAMIIGAKAGLTDFEHSEETTYILIIRWAGGGHDVDAHLKLAQDCLTRKLGFDDKAIQLSIIERNEDMLAQYGESQGIEINLYSVDEPINIGLDRRKKLVIENSSTQFQENP